MGEELGPTARKKSFEVKNYTEAVGIDLQKICAQNDICLVKGLVPALNINLDAFSTQEIQSVSPNQPVEARKQRYHSPLDHENRVSGKEVWSFSSEPKNSKFTLKSYASYQTGYKWSMANRGDQQEASSAPRPDQNYIYFATNIDLSDGVVWSDQLKELNKLPPMFQVDSKDRNMLSYVGKPILGMNTVQLYMKVPGCRTPAHQENNNFCSVNLNVGPGKCTWFAVDEQHWERVRDLCENEHGVKYLSGSWWPSLNDLRKARIPYHKLVQERGDLVWVNFGCIHWVQADDVCNNVAWNVGPATSKQYQLAMERYNWNKTENFESLVPMVRLSWNLAEQALIPNARLHLLIKCELNKTLKDTSVLLERAKKNGVTVKPHGGKEEGESGQNRRCRSHNCREEIFNLLIRKKGRSPATYCTKCISSKSDDELKEYYMEELYSMEKLTRIYREFQPYKIQTQPAREDEMEE